MNAPYHHQEAIHNLAAPREVVPLLMQMVHPSSVLDVGCGTGTWLKAFEEHGLTDYLGVDGGFLDRDLLKIAPQKFLVKDLRQPFSLGRTFDLVICLEVAEHLEDFHADEFVNSLTRHAGTILFSAAIPGQGGQFHRNEQWPGYWQEKFSKYGFHFHDVIRPVIWNNTNVAWWYRQNIFLLTRKDTLPEGIMAAVHPELFEQVRREHQQYLESLLSGRQGMRVTAKAFFQAILFKIKSLFRP